MKRLFYYLMLAVLMQACEKSPTADLDPDKNADMPEVLSNGTWEQLAGYSGRTAAHTAGFGIADKVYIGTGYYSGELDEFWEYSVVENVWSQKAAFGGGKRADAVGFSIGNKGYLFGGVGERGLVYPVNDLWEYDPAKNRWTKKADLPSSGRYYAVAFTIDQYAYVATGLTYIADTRLMVGTDELWQYDPLTDTWTKKAPFGGGCRVDAAGFSIGDKGYLGVGSDYNGYRYGNHNDFWEYDSKRDKWTRKADFVGVNRTEAVALGINSLKRGYLGFGYGFKSPTSPSSYLTDFWEYDPAKDKWIQRSSGEGVGLSNAVSINLGDVGYFGPGNTLLKNRSFWKFDPLK